jgi:manganese/iron transport system ATP-binding protein
MLEVQELGVEYRETSGLKSVSFCLHSGELVGLIGPNGAGKSTMFKALLGLVPTKGIVSYCDCPLHQQLEKVAYVPQRSQIDWDYPITVWNVVMMARTRHLGWFRSPGVRDRKIVDESIERVEIESLKNRKIGELSGGQQQRVFLARALAQEAELFLLDEPLTGVDQKTESIIYEIFSQLKREGKILLISSHDWGDSINQLDRLLLLNQYLIADGSPKQVMTADNLQEAYGKLLSHKPYHQEDHLIC